MRISVLSFVFLFFIQFVAAQPAQMPAQTHAIIQVIQKDLGPDRHLPSQHLLDYYPIYRQNGQYYIAAMGKINSLFDKARAIKDGYDVGAIIGSIVSLRIPLDRLVEGFTYPGIEYIEVVEKLEPDLDRAVKDIRADLVHQGINLPQPFTGKDVLIGVVDWGFDYTQPMFYDTAMTASRILAAWDQVRTTGTPPPGFSHGSFYSSPEELEAAQSDTFSIISDYHGTHVAGIAGGGGASTPYRGVGFESQFLFSQMRSDVGSSMDAFQWMYEMAQAAGKRLVINNSWGGYRTYPLDGTSLLSQAIDALSDAGVVFVFSAGNNGDINFHLKKTFDHDSLRTRIMGFNYNTDSDLWGETVSMWGEVDHPFSVQFRVLSSTNQWLNASEMIHTASSTSFIDTFMLAGTDTVFYNMIIDAAHPLNGRPQVTLNIKNKNQSLRNILYAEAESGTVHFWNTRLTVYGGGNWGYGFTAPAAGYALGDKNYGVGHPGVTNSAITCAAHETNFLLTYFSSYGPRMDEELKPDISAPGLDIISSFNSYAIENVTPVTSILFNNRTYKFIRLSGTSMSAPMVTGAVALVLEADPSLSPAEVKQLIINSARTDALTGPIGAGGDVRWGYGKLDVYNAMQNIFNTAVATHTMDSYSIFPNPADERIYIAGDLRKPLAFQLSTLDGQVKMKGLFTSSIDIHSLMNGLYILSLNEEDGITTKKIVIHR